MSYDERTWTSPIDKIIDATMDAWSDALEGIWCAGIPAWSLRKATFHP